MDDRQLGSVCRASGWLMRLMMMRVPRGSAETPDREMAEK